MNIPVLLQAKADILAHPDQCVMHSYYATVLELPDGPFAGGCRTAGCIAGWMTHRKYGEKTLAESRRRNYEEPLGDPETVATAYAELGVFEAHRLFHLSDWPRELREQYNQARTSEEQSKIMAERIDRFIETKGEE